MLKKLQNVLAISYFLSAASAGATDVSAAQTMWIRGYPVTIAGDIIGCGIEYNAVGRDFAYKQGNWAAFTGSVEIRENTNDGRIFAILKLIVDDVEGDQLTAIRPSSIHFVTSNGDIVKGDPALAQASDTPGALIQGFEFDSNFTKIIPNIVDDKKLTIAFNRTKGGIDLRLLIDLTVKSVDPKGVAEYSDEMVNNFTICMSTILNRH
jgi:hypothetical protein